MEGLKLSKLFWGVLTDVLQAEPDNAIAKQLFNFQVVTDKINFIDVIAEDKAVQTSFLPASRAEKVATADKFFSNLRQTAKLGATVQKVLESKPDENALRHFIELFSAKLMENDFNITPITGKAIKKWFSSTSYAEEREGSELWKSCMRHPACQKYMGFYEHNQNLDMIIAVNDNHKLVGRALLWKNVEVHNHPEILEKLGKERVSFLDRIYAVSPQAKSVMWRWGMKNADLLHSQPKNARRFVLSTDRTMYSDLLLSQAVENCKFGYYPWVDTLQYLSIAEGRIYNDQAIAPTGLVRLHNVEGYFERLNTNSPYLEEIRKELKNGTTK